MDLNRSDTVPEWEKKDPSQWNRSQRIAAKTGGVVTLANVVSVAGATIFIDGLYDFTQGQKVEGIAKMAGGASLDKVDGIISRWLGTRGPFGEALDASLDKIKLFIGLVTVGVTESVPLGAIVAVGAQNAANVFFTFVAKHRDNEIHPDKVNKYVAAGQIAAMGAFLVADTLAPGMGQQVAEIAGYAGTVVVTGFGIDASRHLYNYAYNPQQHDQAA